MIGFFEHQFLSYKKNHLINLIALAKVDGDFHDDEEKLIYKLGEKYGLKDRQIASLITSVRTSEPYIPDTHEGKMNQLHDLLVMVYADGVVDDIEISFCEEIAEFFNLDPGIVQWMMQFFKDGKRLKVDEWEEVVKASRQYIITK